MSIKCMTRVWEQSKAKGSVLLLMLAIADYAHEDGTNAWPSIETLAQKTRMSPRNVQYLIRKAQAIRELEVKDRGDEHRSNLYKIVFKDANIAPLETERVKSRAGKGAKSRSRGVQTSASKGAKAIAPDPVHEAIKENDPERTGDADASRHPLGEKPKTAADLEFEQMPSASEDLQPVEHTAATADPRAERREFRRVYADRFAGILLHEFATDKDKAAAGKLFDRRNRYDVDWAVARLAAYANGAGAEFRKPEANAFWILNKLDEEWALEVANRRHDAERRQPLRRASLSDDRWHRTNPLMRRTILAEELGLDELPLDDLHYGCQHA